MADTHGGDPGGVHDRTYQVSCRVPFYEPVVAVGVVTVPDARPDMLVLAAAPGRARLPGASRAAWLASSAGRA